MRLVQASFGPLTKRMAAYAIDICLIFAWFFVTQQFLLSSVREAFAPGWMRSGYLLELYTLLTISAPVWLYLALTESSKVSATVGKRILRLEVRSLVNERLGVGRALIRAVT